jgi:fused signal recognition particle receptor
MATSWIILATAVALVVVVALVLVRRRAPQAPPGTDRAARPPALERLRQGLSATRQRLAAPLESVFGRADDLGARLGALEEVLVGADVGVATAGDLVARVRGKLPADADPAAVRRAVQEEMTAMLDGPPAPVPSSKPWVVLVMGVNGVGKTTTIAKLAALHAHAGRRVLLVAADTFRAAAIDQLGVWGERVGADVVRQRPGSDPAAVVFDGLQAAKARDIDVVLVDTAGRLHTRANLMEELRKLQRVIAREVPGAPHETLLVLDATTGQNAVVQARTFSDAARVTGVVLTKLDGTARGGVALAVRREIGAPVQYAGFGEAVDDLRTFDAHDFVAALFGDAGNS